MPWWRAGGGLETEVRLVANRYVFPGKSVPCAGFFSYSYFGTLCGNEVYLPGFTSSRLASRDSQILVVDDVPAVLGQSIV